ncbi:hypothetical protein [uncultured Kordia sp.]|uniref:hypothetical protein n=1 Tax=uncultured Kordia sp. TaxID=507699 RepID=UPI002632600A|nr:hypothetical protein [uncultured Kordia sp.]
MKKKNLNSLSLNKKSISNFSTPAIKGGTFNTISCQPIGICAETQGCNTDNNCPTDGCTVGCNPTAVGCNPSNGCPTISCEPVGICK